jgi:hypothetical protein
MLKCDKRDPTASEEKIPMRSIVSRLAAFVLRCALLCALAPVAWAQATPEFVPLVIRPGDDGSVAFHTGKAPMLRLNPREIVSYSDTRIGFKNKAGQVFIEATLLPPSGARDVELAGVRNPQVYRFFSGHALVKTADGWGLIDRAGTPVGRQDLTHATYYDKRNVWEGFRMKYSWMGLYVSMNTVTIDGRDPRQEKVGKTSGGLTVYLPGNAYHVFDVQPRMPVEQLLAWVAAAAVAASLVYWLFFRFARRLGARGPVLTHVAVLAMFVIAPIALLVAILVMCAPFIGAFAGISYQATRRLQRLN